MIRNIEPAIWEFAKEICRIKHEGKQFKGQRDCKKFVKENIHLLDKVVNGYCVADYIK